MQALRQQAGLSQAQFAQRAGIPKGTLLNDEQGRRERPASRHLRPLSRGN